MLDRQPAPCFSIRCLRTTLTVDDYVLQAVQERARRERRSAGAVLSDLARQAPAAGNPAVARGGAVAGFVPLPARGGLVTNALIDSLREDE